MTEKLIFELCIITGFINAITLLVFILIASLFFEISLSINPLYWLNNFVGKTFRRNNDR